MEDKNKLIHWGIKGQKWGERRYQYENGTLTPEGRIRYGYGELKKRFKKEKSSDYERYQQLKKKKSYELSNKELQELNNRQQLENQRRNNHKNRGTIGQDIYNATRQMAVMAIAGVIIANGKKLYEKTITN